MSAQPEITQRDLRIRSREIMDAVEHGSSFTVTRDGRQIGELIPLRHRRRFVPAAEFAALSREGREHYAAVKRAQLFATDNARPLHAQLVALATTLHGGGRDNGPHPSRESLACGRHRILQLVSCLPDG